VHGFRSQRTSKDNAVYHSVKLDDPSFPAPIYANLVAVDEGYAPVLPRGASLSARRRGPSLYDAVFDSLLAGFIVHDLSTHPVVMPDLIRAL
jgi:Protein of unknown function (DUF736)